MLRSIILISTLLVGFTSASNVLTFGQRDVSWTDEPLFLITQKTNFTAETEPHHFQYYWFAPGFAKYTEVQVFVDGVSI